MTLRATLMDVESLVRNIEVCSLMLKLVDEAMDDSRYFDNDVMSFVRSKAVDDLVTNVEFLRESFENHHAAFMSVPDIQSADASDKEAV